MTRTVILGIIAMLLAGCAGSNQDQAESLQQRGRHETFIAKGDYRTVYDVLLGYAQGTQGSAGFANDYVVQGLPHPATESAEIFYFLSNAFLGNQLHWCIQINKRTEDTCTVTVLTPKGVFDKNNRYARQVERWLEQEALLVR